MNRCVLSLSFCQVFIKKWPNLRKSLAKCSFYEGAKFCQMIKIGLYKKNKNSFSVGRKFENFEKLKNRTLGRVSTKNDITSVSKGDNSRFLNPNSRFYKIENDCSDVNIRMLTFGCFQTIFLTEKSIQRWSRFHHFPSRLL